ncbi:hypothetical protein AAFF39_10215 [Lactococcus garvieae]
MNITLLVFHPDINQSKVNRKLIETIDGEIETRLLYELYPEGKIDVKKSKNP